MGNGTSIGRVRGLGSAHSGSQRWLMERYSAIALLPLTIWLMVSFLLLPDFQYATVHEWISGIVPATAIALLVIASFWHARLGLQVVIEDYVHRHGAKLLALVALDLSIFAGAAFALFCIVRLALGASA